MNPESTESVERARPGASAYMHWAKTRQGARFNLAVSGVPSATREDLGARVEDIELTGPSFYGWPPLQEALAQHLGVGPDRIVHAEGTSFANHLALAAFLKPGDEVLLETPGYALLEDTARFLGAVPRLLPRPRESGFQPDIEFARAALTPRTRLIVLTNLHNPTSARIDDSRILEWAALAAGANARLLVDEVYLEAVPGEFVTSHRLDERIVVTSSLTKVYGLSGLRCGWIVADPETAERIWRLKDLYGSVSAHPAERLGVLALKRAPELRRRSLALLETNRARWNAFVSTRDDLEDFRVEAGTVAFPKLRRGSVDALCALLRERWETTVAPGKFFGEESAFRVGLGAPEDVFEEGLRRLGLALDELRREG